MARNSKPRTRNRAARERTFNCKHRAFKAAGWPQVAKIGYKTVFSTIRYRNDGRLAGFK